MHIDVRSEIDPLELVVTSRPGHEFDHMVPENLEAWRTGPDGRPVPNPDYLQFDDLVLRSALQREHRTLEEVVRAATDDAGQVDVRTLLATALGEPEAREEAIAESLELEQRHYGVGEAPRREARSVLRALDATRLAEALVSGREPEAGRAVLRWPLPNMLFARDLAAAVGDALVPSYAATPARSRDMALMRLIVRHHPLLSRAPRIDLADDGPLDGRDDPNAEPVTFEAGDLQVLAPGVVLVGVGTRTTMRAVERLAARLHEHGVETVLACQLPRRRAAMHMDTLFTRIDTDACLVYPPLYAEPERLGIRIQRLTPAGRQDAGSDLLEVLRAEGIELEPIPCGGADPVAQAREQWSDGANAFALAPGVVVCYGRNERTLRELSARGWEIVEPAHFVANAVRYTQRPGHRVAVRLFGHELVRGRGGPRCLTLPLRRASSGAG